MLGLILNLKNILIFVFLRTDKIWCLLLMFLNSHQNLRLKHLAVMLHRVHFASYPKIHEDNKTGSKMRGTLPAAVTVPECSMGGFFPFKEIMNTFKMSCTTASAHKYRSRGNPRPLQLKNKRTPVLAYFDSMDT